MPRGAADNNASLSHDLSSAIVSVGGALRNTGGGKGERGSAAVTNCRSTGRVRERDTSVYAYICFRANTLYNSYEADDLGDCWRAGKRTPEAGKRERLKESESRMDHSCIVYRRYIATDLSPRIFATVENINNASRCHDRERGRSTFRFFPE